ncbi:MAG: undecaprenyl-diphosphate phosphatase [Parcubacteria group bacterium]|nr:undecaprenyl-diphosphate phosphatase [Parcubacteria group bacterium]
MLTYIQAILIGALQGITELFPISSLGHTVLLPQLLSWNIDQGAEFFVVFLVATHFATALVLLAFFWNDWWKIIFGFFRTLRARRIPAGDTYARLSWLIIAATIPAGLLGLLLDKEFEQLFAAPVVVALFLIGNGFLLYGAELLRRGRDLPAETTADEAIVQLSFKQALGIGSMQALALLPGFSRTGAALAGGLIFRLSHESAARFSFLLATPLIFAAAALKLPQLFHGNGFPVGEILAGALVSAACAYIAIRYLTSYFKTNTLKPFAYYCMIAGAIALVVLH